MIVALEEAKYALSGLEKDVAELGSALRVDALKDVLYAKAGELDAAAADTSGKADVTERAMYFRDVVIPLMEDIRADDIVNLRVRFRRLQIPQSIAGLGITASPHIQIRHLKKRVVLRSKLHHLKPRIAVRNEYAFLKIRNAAWNDYPRGAGGLLQGYRCRS